MNQELKKIISSSFEQVEIQNEEEFFCYALSFNEAKICDEKIRPLGYKLGCVFSSIDNYHIRVTIWKINA